MKLAKPQTHGVTMNQDQQRIYKGVKACVIEGLTKKPAQIEPASRLQEDLGATLLDMVDIIVTLQFRFDIKIKGGNFVAYFKKEGRVLDIKTLSKYVVKKLKAKHRPKKVKNKQTT